MTELSAMNDDVLVHILLNLPLKSLLRCTSVCKAWRRLISDDHVRRRLPLIASAIVYRCGDELGSGARYASTVTDTGSLAECGLDFFPFHGSSAIIDCCNGLVLCCARAQSNFYVVSPTTRRWTALPKHPRRSQLSLLVFDPCHSPEYKVVSFAGWRAQGADLDVFSSDTGRWDEREVHWGLSSDAMSATIRCFDGALHVLAYPNYVVQVDMGAGGDMACRLIELPEPAMKREDCVGKCGGRLHYAHADGDELRIWALTELPSGCRWTLKRCMSIGAILEWSSRMHGSSASDLLNLPLVHQFSFLAFHPEREELVYIYVHGKLISCDMSRKNSLEVVCEPGKWKNERTHLLQLWLFPFSDNLSDCLLKVNW